MMRITESTCCCGFRATGDTCLDVMKHHQVVCGKYQDIKYQAIIGDTRAFATGATRGKDDDKLDYEGFLSPLVLERYAEYMHKCRLRNIPVGDTIRSSDNWQKGMSLDSYMKSGFRHFMEWWKSHRGWSHLEVSLEEALCALLFNVQGYLHELIKSRMNGTRKYTREPSAEEAGNPSLRTLPEVSKCQSFDPQN